MDGEQRIKMNTIKAIDTSYGNCLFRSRLEARWAVFFDALGIKWNYELEGFEFTSGGKAIRYLPDFYLPDFPLYVEIKPSYKFLDKAYVYMLESFSENYSILLIIGEPKNYEMQYFGMEVDDSGGGICVVDVKWRILDEIPTLLARSNKIRTFYVDNDCSVSINNIKCSGFDAVNTAIEKAQSKRFEYGDKE
jgi:hypothetical protein